MTDLLLHSMAEFAQPILACLEAAGARNIVEIGAEFGGMSDWLGRHTDAVKGQLTSIDPAPKPEFIAWAANKPHVTHIAKPSLEAIDGLCDVDAWLIDGDHNYYTVSRELAGLDAICSRDGKPLLVFLHDVAWPCARRDMYYAPDRIPAEHRHPHSFDGGVLLDDDGIHPGRGFRGMGHFAFAERSGGARNGVLTAVEDFVAGVREDGRDVAFALVPAVLGLGVIFAADASWSGKLAEILLPLHDNPLIARMEENRLRNYLTVIDWQDRTAAESQAAQEAAAASARVAAARAA